MGLSTRHAALESAVLTCMKPRFCRSECVSFSFNQLDLGTLQILNFHAIIVLLCDLERLTGIESQLRKVEYVEM